MELKEIFSLFSKETERLGHAQSTLKKEIATLKEKLEASHETLTALFTHFADGLLYVSDAGIVDLCNDVAASLLDNLRSNMVGLRYSALFTDNFFGFSMTEMLQEKKGSLRLFLTLQGSKKRSLEILASPIRGKKGGVLLLIKDTAGGRLEKTREQCEELGEVWEVVGSLAHEIRNPLTAIDGFATLLAGELKEQEAREKAQYILEGTQLISRLIHDALSFCSTTKVKLSLSNLEELAREVICHFEAATQIKGRVKLISNSLPPQVWADSELLKLALFNLLKNGMEASQKDGLIHVEITIDKDFVAIGVRDEGIGIEPAALEKLFTPRFTTKSSGNGLGLAETYKAILAQGGTLTVESKKNEGSTFTIKLPRSHAT